MAPPITGSPRSWTLWRCLLTALCALGLALSAYLGWHHLMGGSVIGCGGGSGCDQVLSSRWSAVRGVLPISGLAAGAYLAMLMASFFIGPKSVAPDRRLAWGAILILVGAAAGSAVWFIIIQKWFIGAFCPYCMATHTTSLLLAALVVWCAPMYDPSPAVAPINSQSAAEGSKVVAPAVSPAAPRRLIGFWPAIGLGVVGLALAGAMAGLQLSFTPPPAYHGGAAQSQQPALDPHAVPLVGSPDAAYVVNMFFDYKCPHCQRLHSLLQEAIARYNGQLAFALNPAPLNTQCNPYVPRDVEAFQDSCELAKIGLAVWRAQRAAFPAFDLWMFSPEPGQLWHPRSLDAARAKAVELVGQKNFDAAGADPWIDEYLQTSVRMFGDTIGQGGNAVPKLVFRARWVTPDVNNVDDLVTILNDTLLKP